MFVILIEGSVNVVVVSPAPYIVPITAYSALYVCREMSVPSHNNHPLGADAVANELTMPGGIFGCHVYVFVALYCNTLPTLGASAGSAMLYTALPAVLLSVILSVDESPS